MGLITAQILVPWVLRFENGLAAFISQKNAFCADALLNFTDELIQPSAVIVHHLIVLQGSVQALDPFIQLMQQDGDFVTGCFGYFIDSCDFPL